jgi:Pentapeptide repeats (8 copies)
MIFVASTLRRIFPKQLRQARRSGRDPSAILVGSPQDNGCARCRLEVVKIEERSLHSAPLRARLCGRDDSRCVGWRFDLAGFVKPQSGGEVYGIGPGRRRYIRAPVWRDRPESWGERRGKVKRRWALPFVWFDYATEWVAYALNHWTFLEVLEYLGKFGVLVAVVFYFAESGDRLKQKHYQAWQVINSAQGKGGNGGRIEALEELNMDRVPLVGVDLSSAFLQGVRLKKANLVRANLDGADARQAELESARMEDASLRSSNLRGAKLGGALLQGSTLDGADFSGADLRGANLTGTSWEDADLNGANLQGVMWSGMRSVRGANVYGVKNAPEGMVEWMEGHGAVSRKEE